MQQAEALLFVQGDIRMHACDFGRLLHEGDQGPEVNRLNQVAKGVHFESCCYKRKNLVFYC